MKPIIKKEYKYTDTGVKVYKTPVVKELCGKCNKSIHFKYFNYCPYCGEFIERDYKHE